MSSHIPNIGSGGGGAFWYGDYGFLFKKKGAVGGRKNPSYGLICNQPQNIFNKYTPGSGVGGSSPAVRRAKMRLATSCNPNQPCGPFYSSVGIDRLTVSRYSRNND